jgi:adenylate cyclase class 2
VPFRDFRTREGSPQRAIPTDFRHEFADTVSNFCAGTKMPSQRFQWPAKMTYEVELKFPIADVPGLLARLSELGAVSETPVQQRDLYFSHPLRDFARTDEALRLRSVEERNCITYKGPRVDEQTKTRREIEIPFAEGTQSAAQLREILEILGFHEVRAVEKKRSPFTLEWQNRGLELALDDVAGLGTYFEIETIADDSELNAARNSILDLASRLGLANAERKSYLCLLLENAEM